MVSDEEKCEAPTYSSLFSCQVTSLISSFYVLLGFPFWSNNWSNQRPESPKKSLLMVTTLSLIYTNQYELERLLSDWKSLHFLYLFFGTCEIQQLYFTKQSPGKTKSFLSRSYRTFFLKQRREAFGFLCWNCLNQTYFIPLHSDISPF